MQNNIEILIGDCLSVMSNLEENSFDVCITDPPYGIDFSGKHAWDKNIEKEFHRSWSAAVKRVLKPGAFLISFASSRTQHIIASAFEDAGLTIKDVLTWTYKTGFPKNHDMGKKFTAIGDEENATKWHGWGTALKPTYENIILAQTPFEGPIYKNLSKWGVGAINIGANHTEDGYPSNTIYSPKVSSRERDEGCEALIAQNGCRAIGPRSSEEHKHQTAHKNFHPTVKPLKVMSRLVALFTPPNGKILEPFLGSGSTLVAAQRLGFSGIGIEMDAAYAEIALHRLGLQKTL